MELRERIARIIGGCMGNVPTSHNDMITSDAVLAELAPVLDAAREVVAEPRIYGLTWEERRKLQVLREALRRVEGEGDERA